MNLKNGVLLVLILSMTGCADLPHSGPSSASMKAVNKDQFVVQEVTPDMALAMHHALEQHMQAKTAADVALLRQWSAQDTQTAQIAPGDILRLTLWTNQISLFHGGSFSTPLHKTRLGHFVVNDLGMVHLPYIGSVKAAGLSLTQFTQMVNQRYRSTGQFIDPSVSARWGKKGYLKGVLVSGDVQHPGLFAWHPGGLSLAGVLAKAGLAKSRSAETAASSGKNGSVTLGANEMVTIDDHRQQVRLPFTVIYARHLRISSGAHILVTQSAPYKINLLGGGVSHPGVYAFGSPPSVNSVFSVGGGLNPHTANDRQIFVLQPSISAHKKSILYVLKWNTPSGLLAAQRMPLQNHDVVYVSTAPVVPLEKAAQIFSSFMFPAAVLGTSIH